MVSRKSIRRAYWIHSKNSDHLPMSDESTILRYRYPRSPLKLADFMKTRYFRDRDRDEIESIIQARVQVNGRLVDGEAVLKAGDWIEYRHLRSDEGVEPFEPEIIFEDKWLIAISKPDHLPVTPTPQCYFNALAIRMKEWSGNPSLNPAHRLDLETSGVLIFGKTPTASSELQKRFERRQIKKRYQAVTFDQPKTGTIRGCLKVDRRSRIYTKLRLEKTGTPESITIIEELRPWGNYHRLWLDPLTGRTNQIRAHLAAIGCPIVGDKKYFPDESVFLDWIEFRDISRIIDHVILSRQALFCERIDFAHPFWHKPVSIQADIGAWENKIRPLRLEAN